MDDWDYNDDTDQKDQNTHLQAKAYRNDPTVDFHRVVFGEGNAHSRHYNPHAYSLCEGERGRKRTRSRWQQGGDNFPPSTLAQLPKIIPGGMTTEQQEAMLGKYSHTFFDAC